MIYLRVNGILYFVTIHFRSKKKYDSEIIFLTILKWCLCRLCIYATDNRKFPIRSSTPWRVWQANGGYSRRVYEPFYCDSLHGRREKKVMSRQRSYDFNLINWQVITRGRGWYPRGRKNFPRCSFSEVSTYRGNIRQSESFFDSRDFVSSSNVNAIFRYPGTFAFRISRQSFH